MPTELADASPRVMELATAIYATPDGAVGGGLHIVLDDWNIEDEQIEWCLDNEHPLTPVEDECARLLLGMTFDQRAATLARWYGFTTA